MKLIPSLIGAALMAVLAVPAFAASGQDAVLQQYLAKAKAAGESIAAFSAARGEALYHSRNAVTADAPSCSTCHTDSPLNAGQTRAGKAIEPMAVSASSARFTDIDKTEKWFTRNCKTVLGRDCSLQEKGDFITYLSGL